MLTSFLELSFFMFVVFYWAYSTLSPLNIGVRHILPTIPLMYILATVAWRKFVHKSDQSDHSPVHPQTRSISFVAIFEKVSSTFRKAFSIAWKVSLLVILLLWSVDEALAVAPHFLSYYNELGGGTANGYKFIDDSNYDWGQDLLALRDTLNAHPEIDKIAVDYFGGGNARHYLGDREIDWNSPKGDPRAQGIHWFAISANIIEEATQPTVPGYYRRPEDRYSWLTSWRTPEPGMGGIPKPDLRVGTSIFIYHMP
jgi:hypothetical protein